jgi:hypothetical protein
MDIILFVENALKLYKNVISAYFHYLILLIQHIIKITLVRQVGK